MCIRDRPSNANQREYCFNFTPAAFTWTKVTHSIPGHASNTLRDDNQIGAFIQFIQYWGTNYTSSGRTNEAWQAKNNNSNYPDIAGNWYNTNDATLEITGIQLEVGDTATSFEHRSPGEDFARCQRYYQQYVNISAVGYVPNNSNRTYSHGWFFPVAMRAKPTLTLTNTGSSGGQYVTDGQTNRYIASALSQGATTTHMSLSLNLTGDLSDYRGAYLFGTENTQYQTTYKILAEL